MAGAGSLKPASAKSAVASEAATDGGIETFGTGGAGHSAEAGSGKAPKMNLVSAAQGDAAPTAIPMLTTANDLAVITAPSLR
jgi:hypothetical protein